MVTLQGGETITVLASRRAAECGAVQVLVGLPDDPALCLHGWVEPVQARVLARALIEAASAAEAAQRRMVLEQPAARHACPRCGCGHVGDYTGPGLHRCPTCREVLQRVEGQQS